jgi:hypothetical protein
LGQDTDDATSKKDGDPIPTNINVSPDIVGLNDGGLLEEEKGLVVQLLRLQRVTHVVVQLGIL